MNMKKLVAAAALALMVVGTQAPLSPATSMHTVFAWKKYQILTKPEELFLKQLYSLLHIIKAEEPENKSQPESPHPRR